MDDNKISPCNIPFSPGIGGELRMFLLLWVLLFLFLLMCYMPAVSLDFAHHDDYFFWANRTHPNQHPSYEETLMIGRPVFGALLNLYVMFVKNISDLSHIRFITIFIFSICAALLAFSLQREDLTWVQAFLIGAGVYTLPGVQVLVSWVICTPIAVALLLASISGCLVNLISIDGENWKRNRLKNGLSAAAVVVFLILSLLIYQPSAMFFLIFTAGNVIFSKGESRKYLRRRVLRDFFLLGVGGSIYFLGYKYAVLPYLSKTIKLNLPSTYNFAFTGDIFSKIKEFISVWSIQALNLWSISPNKIIAYGLAVFILIGMAVYLVGQFARLRGENKSSIPFFKYFLKWIGAIFILIMGVNAPNILASGGHSAYRLTFIYSALIVLLAVWAAKQILAIFSQKLQNSLLLIFLTIMVGIGGISAQKNVLRYFAANNFVELAYIKTNLAPHLDEDLKNIHVVRPDPSRSFADSTSRYDEFGAPSSGFDFDIPWIIRSIYLSSGRDVGGIRITSSAAGETYSVPPGTLVIDMTLLQKSMNINPGDYIEKLTRQISETDNIFELDEINRNFTKIEDRTTGEFKDLRAKFEKMYQENWKKLLSDYNKEEIICEEASFIDYYYKKLDDERYMFYLLFKANGKFDNDWRIYLHGYVRDKDVDSLLDDRKQYGFDNWVIDPDPKTSLWRKDDYIIILGEIKAKPLPYNMKIGFYRDDKGQHGKEIDLGWIDLGSSARGLDITVLEELAKKIQVADNPADLYEARNDYEDVKYKSPKGYEELNGKYREKLKELLSKYEEQEICDEASFISHYYKKIGDEKHRLYYVFKVKKKFEKDWRIFLHGYVRDEDLNLLPGERRQHKFDNWPSDPDPATSSWNKDDFIIITQEINAKPIPYNMHLGFYTVDKGQHGKIIDLGWLDFGSDR